MNKFDVFMAIAWGTLFGLIPFAVAFSVDHLIARLAQ
jgi:hypothetical protein